MYKVLIRSDSTFTRLSEMRRELTQKNTIFDEKDRLLELKPTLEHCSFHHIFVKKISDSTFTRLSEMRRELTKKLPFSPKKTFRDQMDL